MDNVLIDDRRIHVDFSQSVAKIKWKGKGTVEAVVVYMCCVFLLWKVRMEQLSLEFTDTEEPERWWIFIYA